jgi:hypothetical protein
MSYVQALWRLGVFMILALPVVQCQTSGSTAPSVPKKAAAPAKNPDVAKKKAVDEAAKKKADADETAKKAAADEAAKKAADAAKAATIVKLENVRLDAVDSDYASMSLHDCVPGKPDPTKIVCDGKDSKAYHVKVNDKDLKAHLKQFHLGDHLRVDINGNNELQDLRGPWSVPSDDIPNEISPACRFLILIACALFLLGLAALVTGGAPLKFIVGMDNRYSNSKFQLALWFWVVLSTYLATVVFRVWYAGWDFFGGVSIPQNLLVLSGLSAITYGGAKAITTSKVNSAMNPAPVAVAVTPSTNVPSVAVAMAAPADPAIGVVVHAPPNPAPTAVAVTPPANLNPKNAQPVNGENILTDLVQNDFGGFDFGDFQMIVVTLVAVVMYGTLIYHFLGSIQFLKTVSLPDVDTTVLAGFGLGQGAYLAKKAGGNVGTS